MFIHFFRFCQNISKSRRKLVELPAGSRGASRSGLCGVTFFLRLQCWERENSFSHLQPWQCLPVATAKNEKPHKTKIIKDPIPGSSFFPFPFAPREISVWFSFQETRDGKAPSLSKRWNQAASAWVKSWLVFSMGPRNRGSSSAKSFNKEFHWTFFSAHQQVLLQLIFLQIPETKLEVKIRNIVAWGGVSSSSKCGASIPRPTIARRREARSLLCQTSMSTRWLVGLLIARLVLESCDSLSKAKLEQYKNLSAFCDQALQKDSHLSTRSVC